MLRNRRWVLVTGLGAAAAAAGCAPKPAAPLEPTAGTQKAVLVAEGMH